MRLLNTSTYGLKTFYGDDIQPYAILSHTWLQDDQEVTFADITSTPQSANPSWAAKRGAAKIRFLCLQARNDGFEYAWIDTCCIDKANSSELSEAINSMYQWYEKSGVCYACLADVKSEQDFLVSRWWTRAWTLQELLAPSIVIFYDAFYLEMGTKATMSGKIAIATGIDELTLQNPRAMFLTSVARRMSWAAHRLASRSEDIAYSLLGIFEINMPMQYGEGEKAFVRLQREIMKTTKDHSLFAWGFSALPLENILASMPHDASAPHDNELSEASEAGLFASHPRAFGACGSIIAHSVLDHSHVKQAKVEENQGDCSIESETIIRSAGIPEEDLVGRLSRFQRIVLLPCSIPEAPHSVLGIVLRLWQWHHPNQEHPARAVRDGLHGAYTVLVSSELAIKAEVKKYLVDSLQDVARYREFAKDERGVRAGSALRRTLIVKTSKPILALCKTIEPPGWQWSPNDALLCMHTGLASDHLALQFASAAHSSRSKEARWALLVSLQLGSNNFTPDRITVQTMPVSRLGSRLSEQEMRAAADRTEITNQGEFCNAKVKLYARIETRYIFNQAITTLTIDGLLEKQRADRDKYRPNDQGITAKTALGASAAVVGGFMVGSAFGGS